MAPGSRLLEKDDRELLLLTQGTLCYCAGLGRNSTGGHIHGDIEGHCICCMGESS